MVRNIVVFGLSSHPELSSDICNLLGIEPGKILCGKFANGETRVEIKESVRGKDVYVIQSGCGKVNDNVAELLITIAACKTASANRITVVLPVFPYSRQVDIPYEKTGAPSRAKANGAADSSTASPSLSTSSHVDGIPPFGLDKKPEVNGHANGAVTRSSTFDSLASAGFPTQDYAATTPKKSQYKQWVAQAGTLVADLITCAGANHVMTMDLHDAQYQGFFDIPVDNLYARPLLQNYIQYSIPDFQSAVVVSPDAGGAKRATTIADALLMPFALIHKENRPTVLKQGENSKPTMMLVGDVKDKVAILIDDMADTTYTLTRAAKLLKMKGATKVYALVSHGIFSGDAIERINRSDIDTLVCTNSVPQSQVRLKCPKLEVLGVGQILAEAIRRVHHGESLSTLFDLKGI